MSKKETQVANKETTDLIAGGIDFGIDIGAGMENADAASFAIPFLTVVQKMSPVCDEASGSYNPNAKAGMLMNTVTGDLIDGKEGIVLLPCHYQRRFLRWGPKEQSGGFKGEFLPEVAAMMEHEGTVINQDGRLFFPLDDGTVNEKKCDRLADVRNHFCVIEGSGMHVLLSLGSTQIKKSKALMSMLSSVKVPTPSGQRVTPPTWANRVRLQTVLEQNDQGSWHGVKFTLEGMTQSKDDYEAGKAFYNSLKEGRGGEVRYHDEQAGASSTGEKF